MDHWTQKVCYQYFKGFIMYFFLIKILYSLENFDINSFRFSSTSLALFKFSEQLLLSIQPLNVEAPWGLVMWFLIVIFSVISSIPAALNNYRYDDNSQIYISSQELFSETRFTHPTAFFAFLLRSVSLPRKNQKLNLFLSPKFIFIPYPSSQ